MVDGYESPGGENEPEDQNSRRTIQKVEEERPNDRVSSQPPATTTISTIAVQSGDTRLVIALLQSGEWLRLKVLEVQPGLTKLGASAEEATELLNAHDEVLLQLQSKQSPVEELLRQADQLISTQRPRAEVYAAMAETLGQAWRDVNAHLEHRKQILDSNVLFQCRAEEYRERMKALEMACNDTLLPIEIDAVKNFLTRIHDLRKNMLESLMTALQEGKTLLDKLKEVSNEGTLDSRPDQIKLEADHAILQVERWLEELHDKRRLIEVSFQSRKTQLEQCLALALLATDLRDLEEILNDRIAALASSSDQLGDSSASAELLLFELKKLQPEAKDFQDKSIKITKSTEQLVSSGHFAGEQATEQAYAILSAAADYLNDLDQYETLLNKAISFFRLAQSALTKLDQLEIQLITTEHPPHSAQLAQLHSQAVTMLEDVTAEPLVEGYALIDVTGRGAPGAEGVKRMVEELENRKIQLTNHCTAHKEESLRISQGLTTFLEKYNELYSWLVSIAEAFLQGHQDMGSVLPMAKDFYQLHYQLLSDLQKKGDEINETLKILPPIIEHIDDDQRRDVNNKVDLLHDDWLKLKNIIDARLDLSSLYVKFQEAVADLANEIDLIEYEFKKNSDTLNDEKIEELERKWFALQPLYLKLTASGKQFMDEARKITDPYLDISRACLCVETLMEHFANRQLTVSESWENWQTTITILKEKQIEQKRNVEESTKTLEWVSKFEEQLYPVITSESTKVSNILVDLESSQVSILPELKKAVTELNYRIKSVDALTQKGDDGVSEQIRRKLSEVYEHLQTTTSEYQILLESLISIFKNLEEVEKKTEDAKRLRQSPNLSKDVQEVRFMLKEHENTRQFVVETLKSIERETDRTITKIRQQEPPEAAQQDVDKLKRVIVLEKSSWESSWSEKKSQLEEQLQLCIFDEDVNQINSNLTTLSKQLGTLKGQYKESLPAAKCASESFVKFEKTVMTLEEKIETFIKTTTETISTIYTSAPQVRNELSNLKERWQDLKKQAEDTRKCVDLSIEYFKLLEEAEEWFREGSKLLVTIARKATTVKVPEDATNLLHDVDAYLKPGEEKQDERIRKIRELSTYVFGTDRLSQFNKVIVENREMLDSFTVISSELRTLVQNLKNAEDLRDTLRKEQEEADVKLNAARAEVMVAQAAAAEAENARKVAEILAAQTVEKATEEARRLGEVEAKKAMRAQIEKQKKILTSVSAQTEATDTEVVRETVTSAVTTKEIHILQKTEVEEAIPLPARLFTPKREASPPKKTKLEEAPPVPVPPQFTVPLSNATIQEGERLTFECQLTGFPEPEIVWYKDGISILNNPDYLTNYDHGICTLTIEETFAEDSAQFTCRAFNVAGSTETAATLKVKEIAPEEQLSPPIFSKELQASLATEGTTHQLECRVEGNPLPTVQWFKNESNIDNSPDYIITYNNGEAVLKFEEVFLEDQATYTCKATNQVGQASTFASLSVEPLEPSEKPYFVVPLSNIMARAGQKVKLECEARGIPCPNLSWTHNGKFIKESRDVKIQTEGAKSTLVISEAFPKDAGSYVVSARNLAGEAISSCNVSVKGRLPNETSDSELASDMEPVKPSIQLPLKNVQVFEGQTVRLDCVIIGQPEPEVIWYHDGQPVKESADFQLLFQGDRCSLIIHEAFLDDAGEYKVVAINSGGEASSKCMLSVTLVEAEENLKSQVEKVPAGTPPKFIKLLTDVLVAEGEDTLFECMIIGEPKPELKWFLNNNEIVENERIKTTYGEDGTCILKISPTVPEDRGNYIAKATNNLGEAKAFAHLIVKSLSDFQRKEELIQMEEKHVPPMFKERFEERKVFEGSATKFECIVTGRPTPKIQWLFNDQPVCGKDFLISVSGDRQVLTIPETRSDQVGTVSCVAENIAGKATCTAKLKIDRGTNEELELIQVPPDEMQASSSSEKHFSKEKTSSEGGSESILTKMSSTITESSSVHTSTKKEYTSSSTTSSTIVPGQQPTSVCMKTTTHSTEQSSSENGAPPVVQSHKVEEYERIVQDKPGEIRQEKTVIVSKGEEGTKQESKLIQIQKPCRKSAAPKFVSPVTGMIVDQGADIVLEGIVDGYPQPTITWSKNGQELKQRNGVKISYAHNHVRVELKNVNVKDAGRYTCTAVNDVGTANSTADLVVKKTIFPPVFGRRLQAQVVKRGDRVIMEVEITGTPEPTVTWYKNDVPIKEQPPEVRIRQQGNCYLLVIEKVEKEHAGKYMVHAVNTGGEAQSIADFAVFEPTPDTMVEVHKTVVYENVKDKGIVQETVHTVTQSSQQQTLEKRLEPFPYKAADYPRPIPKKVPPPPSPSKFVKGEFRESDYESDYEGRIPPVWKPHGSDNEDYAFKHVKPNLVGTGKLRPTSTEPLPTPPTVFDNPPQYSGPPRPEFKPLDKVIKDTKQTEKKQLLTQKTKSISPQPKLEIVPTTPTKQKSVLLPGSPPEIGYAPPKQQTFYEGRSGAPFHNAIGTEMKKTVRMDESTENTRRILTVEQTSRVIKFGENQNTQNKYSSYDKSSSQQQNRHSVPIPKKFVQGQFRESDYESDADIKIRPKWTPTDSDTEDLHYRKVQAPRSSRSSSVPTQRERVQTPMEFDTQPPVIPQQTIFTQHLQDVNVENRRLQRLEEMRKKFDSQTQVVKQQTSESNQKQEILKLGSPPEFGYVTKNDVKKAANYVASKHISDMTSSFKSKTEKFVKDIQSDLKQKPILKHPPDSQTADGDDTQAYREETRLAQYGTKHIDPDTGLIYFKYDFGYEFGIVLPGEGKKTVSSSSKTIQGQRRASDIDVPIIHEFTTKKENGFAKPSSQFKPSRFTNSKTVKWEPNSESEFSEAEDTRNRKRHSLPQTNFSAPSVVIPTTRWDQTTPSPVSLSPSLPSLSPHHSSVGPPSNVDSAGSPWPSNGVPTAKEVIQPYHDVLPKKAPLFITPLRDIAVVSGQTARFECIVQAEPQPNILWSKDGRIIENSSNYEIQYRNGVCRLTIPRAYPEDAGAYSCTATNGLGSTGTSATLQVPGVPSPFYGTYRDQQIGGPSVESSLRYVALKDLFLSSDAEEKIVLLNQDDDDRYETSFNLEETKDQSDYRYYDTFYDMGQNPEDPESDRQRYTVARRLDYSDVESRSNGSFYDIGEPYSDVRGPEDVGPMMKRYTVIRRLEYPDIEIETNVHGEIVMQSTPNVPLFTGKPGDPSPPVFEQIFKNARFAQGGNAIFEGRVRGNPKPFVSWTHKSAPLLESQKIRMSYDDKTGIVTLQINQIGPGDEGEYTCNAKNQYGEAICSVYIQPEGFGPPPQQQIGGYKKEYAQTFQTTEQKTGSQSFQQRSYQQTIEKQSYANGNITEDFKVDTFEYRLLRETEFRESITRRFVGESDSQISTVVDRSLGPVSPPQITQKPRNSKLIEGSDAVFSAKISANPKPRLTWFKNGQRIRESQRVEISQSSQQATLKVKVALPEDSGHYTLLAENPQGCTVSSAYLAIESSDQVDQVQNQVQQRDTLKSTQVDTTETSEAGKVLPPNFVRTCADREATEGKMTRFDCRVTGRPYPEVTWYINGYQVANDTTHKILVNESGNNSLMITNVSRADAGIVTCVAKNKAGETSFQCNLTVIEKEQVVAPKFVERFTTTNVKEGEPVVFTARAVGTPIPRITWQKDGVPIAPGPDVRISTDGSGASTLDIPQARSSDAAWYQCTAQNVAGSTATRARLFVETPKGTTPEPRRLNLPRPTKVIEPEPAPGPEVIYLKHVERAKPYLPPQEEDRIYPPPQFIIPLRDVHQIEGGRVHFEARIEPVGDPTMRVEWYVNGRALDASSRATSIFRFGFIALDLISIVLHDSGEYLCRVISSTGVVESRATLSVTPRATIEQTSQHPDSLQYIQQLEDYSKYQRQESAEEICSQRPVFIRPLQDLGELQEGRNAHFEAQLTPVSDSTMKVEWYKDGRSITASSRITTIFNFGYVSLNILHLRVEDAGSYTVRAVNRMGEAISTATLRVFARTSVTSDLGIPEQQRYIEAAEELEAYQQAMQQRYVQEQPELTSPPEFKTPIKDQNNIREGGFAHFEARLEPVGDSSLRVEWLKDGRPVEASSRSTTFFNFGYVALTIKYVTIHDVGVYTCRAYNRAGETHTTAQLSVISKNDVIFDSQHPTGLQKIQTLEDSSRYSRQVQEETQVNQPPRFLGPLKGTNKIVEGQRAHFEARVEPQSDLTMKIEWYHNGKSITAANRIQTYHDFGYVAIDILQVRSEDAGTYTVIARNALGEAQLSATMIVETRSSIDTSSMHRGTYEKTQRLEDSKFVEPQYHIEEISKSKPIFVQPLSDPKPLSEGKNIHLECRLEPMGDPTMRVEWFQNGRPITVGSRFRTYYDFGFVALDIVQTTVLDSGEYTVRATNHLGTAHTSACIRIIGRSDIVTDSQNEQSLEQIQMLEDSSKYRRTQQEDVTVMQAPQFTRPLHNIETVELTNVHLECRLQPVGDSAMRVDWFVNGRPVKTGHRFRPSYEFDYVALDILGVYPEDSGVYTCQARNQLGEAVTSCSVRVHAKKDLLLESQHPEGLERIQYLEDASRYKRNELVDEVVNIKPKFITAPKNQENLREGHHAHFECKLEPVTDSNLKVEWFKNGRPVTIGHRFRPIHDFGYVALDVIDLIAEDSGTYTCRAVNLVGSDEVNCNLSCRSGAQILTDTQNEVGLEQIHHLEDRSKYQRQEVIDETTTQAPIFTSSLKSVEIKEGQRAHFECRLIPVSDATMKVEWFHNNKPVKAGSRFIETNSFGFVALDIMYAYPEDSGTYTCRAKNAIGEAITSATAVVHSKQSIYMESQNEEVLQRLQHLEDSSRYQRKTVQEETVTQAPVFTMPIKDLRVAENQAAHFEARVIPVGDSRLKVEWLRNGVPISASNRVTTMHDFGYVALNMKYVNPEDSGTYTCRAINDLGEAVTSATLFVQSKAALQFESQHESALSKLQALEDTSKYQRREEEETVVKDKPSFTVQLNGPKSLVEGQSAHYECRIEPYPDSNMKLEWFHNGKPLSTGHRYRTTSDFGFASLDVLTVYAEDSGTYTCKATNKLGSAQSSIDVEVKSRASIIRDTQHEGALQKIQYLEDDSRYKRQPHEDVIIAEKPKFGRPLKNIEHLPEGKNAHLEATLTPVNDATMVVEWFRDGRPIPQGHKFKTTYDFGFVALDILYAYPEDSGTYMCKARNAVGEAVTTCVISVDSKQGLCLDTLDAQRLQKIRELETVEVKQEVEKEIIHQKPIFLTALNNLDHLKEGEHAHLECRVEPINDANLKIEWFVNGVAIKTGHRFRTTHDFGYVALDILYAYSEDSGTYMCKATNLAGEAVNTCTIKVGSRRSILFDTQHPDGLEKIRELEAQGRPARLEVEEPPISPPRFVTELRGTTEIYEGQTAHFECQVEPLHDANLRIEFFHNGKPLPSASRFHVTFDFGYVALDISHAVPEDAGEYSVRAINALGQCVSSINLKVIPREDIILDSQRPEGMDKIRELEAQQPWKRPEVPEPQTRQRPVFTQPLQNIDNILEGQTAHFECRLIPVGDSTLKVEWFRNEKPLEMSSRITKVHDFGYVSLDISHVRDEDEGVYMCRASNPLGEAVTTASMKIRTKADIQLDTQHPEAQRKIAQLEADKGPSRTEEPDKVFDKPIFTQLLTGPTELWEGQVAHYECRVVPVGDTSLRFEWFVNGVELKMGSRFHVSHDFGFVTLDILKVISEDSGVYSCKAINKAGEAVSSISLKVKARSAIVGDSIQPEAWQKIQLKEAEMNKVPEMFVDTTPQQAPVFTTHLKSYDKLVEGQHVYLEAQVEPRADPNLRVEWFKNGVPLQTGTRLRSTFDFGLVSLSINGVRSDDSAIYTCKATNLLGEAVSTCSLKVVDRHWLLGDTLHPDALSKIDALEQPHISSVEQPEPTYEEPVFITHLNNVVCVEGDNVHFECNVEPSKDPTMKIEWFINGKPLPTGARFKSTYDFGYVALDITNAYEEDSGMVTVKATNSKGSAQTTGTLKCTSKQSIYLQTQHPQGEAGLEKVKEAEDAYLSKYERRDSGPEHEYPKPIWTVPLQPEFKLGESEPLHLEGHVEPKDDPNLKIEWYFNGKQLEHGARFKMTSDFGFVTLDLTDAYDRDSGIYTCKAYNKAGEAFTSTTIYCSTKENIIERSQHPKGKEGLEAIQDLEESLKRQEEALAESEEGHPPVFTSQFENLTNLSEGEIAHFEASLTPTGDQTMVVEWFYNGKSLEASHRTRTVYAFGMVVLEVLGTKIEDSGTYSCRATNKWGKAEISVNLECVDKSKGQKPKFTTHIQSLEGLKDGQSAHFECTLVPVGDPNMKVEWFHNGQPLRHSSRFKMVCDFGFVVMDIAGVMSHDTGEYVCKASNKYGEDYTKATIKCFGKSGVYLDSLQPDSLARIRELESFGAEQPTTPITPVSEPPKFITQITDITKLVEGQSAHFEARLTPITDPDLKVEWYYNGKKLPHGHRYRTFHDFGIVILDILYCYEENSGVYECRAVNKYGEDTTKATLRCLSKTNLILESQLPKGMEGGLEKIQTLEDSLVRTKDEKIVEERGKAPMFTVPLSNIDGLREGESAHFEARLIPTDDTKLKVEWFWNGKPLRTGSRFRTFCDFGFVILEISPIYPEDTGEYSCRATNDYGEAVTTCTMKCTGKRSIILESQLPKGMEGTIDKIAELEGLGNEPGQPSPDDDTGKPPEFITTPSDLTLAENSLAHFECRLQPVNDSSMRVEWFHNGKALLAGSRVKTIHDFGFVILEVANCYQRDSGLYTCKATNRHGEATVSCKLQVRGRQGIILEPQLPSNFKSGTESIQKLEESLYKRDEILTEEETPNPPRFTVELKDIEVEEAGPSHFDCRVEPVGDSTMRIDWYHNGRPFATGSRVHQINDFGFISLDLSYTYARDSGEYVCRATNKWGTATTKATIICKSKKTIDFESQLPSGMSGEKLKELERGPVSEAPAEEAPRQPPRFITQIQSATVDESEPVRFECRVEPKDDPNLRIEWYRNGKLIPAGHRYRTVYDMGFVSMDILYVYPEDSGEYVCKAINDLGEDTTRASVSCKKLPNIILQNQVPKGMKKSEALMQMEATIKKYTSEIHLTEDDLYDVEKKQPPRFVTQIKDQTELVEMNSTKFECQLAPVGDPNMKVEWFLNGKPLPHKNRFTPIYDFGYVAMNFGWVYPEDSGEYLCRATNLYGMDETIAVIKTAGKPGIIYESQLPKGMKSIEKIREMEAAWQVVPDEEGEEEKVRAPPTFVSKPEPFTVEEGDWSRFCCRVTGHPRPRVMWLINGHTVVNGSRYKLTYDGMYHLDIPKTRQYDHGKIEVIARSSVGESRTETFLTVKARSDDYRGVLKNSPRPWYDYGLTQYQSERQNTELERVFDERHQTVSQGIDIATEHLGQKVFKEPETEWQKSVKSKKNEEYYTKLMSLEEEQVLKETRLRESAHQFAIPGDKVVNNSLAKGMAQKYQESLEVQPQEGQPPPTYSKKPYVSEVDIDSQQVDGRYPPEPSESLVHGREVHVAKQKQTQKEVKGDLEITRKITATETTEVEHKAQTKERVVQGQVKPSKPPVFVKKIQPCRAFEQEQARFEVEFDGDPLPTIKWYREDFPIQNSSDLQIYTFSTKSVLIVRQVFMEDSGVFSVIAENRGGKAKCSANLVVEERRRQPGRGGVIPPSFLTTIQNTVVPTGQLARFDAKIAGTKPFDVYWLKNGKKITTDIRYKTLEEDNTYTLLILETVPEDTGKYECVAINGAGEARCDAECTVQGPQSPTKTLKPSTPGVEKAPTVFEPLKDQIIREGTSVAFRCRITGKPVPAIQWKKGDKVIKPSKYFQMQKEGDLCTLRISEAFPEDEGVYKCIAKNPAGEVTSTANLRVLAPDSTDVLPKLTPLKDQIVLEGQPAQFKTQVTPVKSKPTVQWYRDGALIPQSPDFQMIHEGNNAVLLIATTYEEDTGTFTCRATTSAGTVETSAKLIVKSKN